MWVARYHARTEGAISKPQRGRPQGVSPWHCSEFARCSVMGGDNDHRECRHGMKRRHTISRPSLVHKDTELPTSALRIAEAPQSKHPAPSCRHTPFGWDVGTMKTAYLPRQAATIINKSMKKLYSKIVLSFES